MEPERDAAVGLAQVGAAEGAEERARARAREPDAAGAVEQQELRLSAVPEHLAELRRVEAP